MRGFPAERGNSCPFWAKSAASLLLSVGVRVVLLLCCGILTPLALRGQSLATSIYTTGLPTDLRIAGPGYFVERDPIRGAVAVTRQGDFFLDSNGYLLGTTGMRVQGFNDPGLHQIGDLAIGIDGTGMPRVPGPSTWIGTAI